MSRKELQRSILPFGLQEVPKNLPVVPMQPRGFTDLTDMDTGEIEGEPTPSDPEKPPKEKHNQKAMFQAAWAKAKLSLDDMSPYRVRVMWRTLRYISCRLGVMAPNMLLGDMPSEAGDPINGIDLWTRPYQPKQFNPPYPDAFTRCLMALVHQAADQGDEVTYDHLHPTQDRIASSERAGFTLLPTQATAAYWTKAFEMVASQLFLARGSARDREQGRLGMMGLSDPDLCVIACPCIAELLMWELFLVDEATKMLAHSGEHLIDTSFREHYGLLPFETEPIVARARKSILERSSLDIEEQRALMVVRINDVMARARESLDPRAELMALKLLSQTIGITRSEPEDLKSMFRKVVGEANEKRQLDYAQGDYAQGDAEEASEDDE